MDCCLARIIDFPVPQLRVRSRFLWLPAEKGTALHIPKQYESVSKSKIVFCAKGLGILAHVYEYFVLFAAVDSTLIGR